jgi:phage terminase large subunit GpA-like protein
VSSSEPGQWRTERTPYLREPMNCLSASSPVEEVDLMFGTQLGKTETGQQLGRLHDPRRPGADDGGAADAEGREEVDEAALQADARRHAGAARARADPRSRESGNTADMKEFPGGMLIIAGANSASDLRSTPIAKLYLDEIDNYPQDVDNEGDPVELAVERTDELPAAEDPEDLVADDEGLVAHRGAFWPRTSAGTHVPCPHCSEPQSLVWSQLQVGRRHLREAERTEQDDSGVEGRRGRAWYVCQHCGAEIEEHQKTWMLEHGEVGRALPRPARRQGARFPPELALLAGRLEELEALRGAFLKAKKLADAGDTTKLKIFTNTVLAETWEEQGDKVTRTSSWSGSRIQAARAAGRRALLTGAVDVQGNRLEVKVKGWAHSSRRAGRRLLRLLG